VIGNARFSASVSERRHPPGYWGVVPLELTGDVLLAQEEPEFSVHARDRSPMFTNFIVESVQAAIKYSSFGENPVNKIGTAIKESNAGNDIAVESSPLAWHRLELAAISQVRLSWCSAHCCNVAILEF
jgi:hypothetical protein